LFFIIMTTWRDGRRDVSRLLQHSVVPFEQFSAELKAHPPARVPGTAVFMTAHDGDVPPILRHHLKHNKALHERVILLTVQVVDAPTIDSENAIAIRDLGGGFYRVIAKYGYMQAPDVPRALADAALRGLPLDEKDTTFYLAQLTLLVTSHRGLASLRDKLFVLLARNARRATNLFNIPPNRVIEIGMQLEL